MRRLVFWVLEGGVSEKKLERITIRESGSRTLPGLHRGSVFSKRRCGCSKQIDADLCHSVARPVNFDLVYRDFGRQAGRVSGKIPNARFADACGPIESGRRQR